MNIEPLKDSPSDYMEKIINKEEISNPANAF